MHTELQGLRFFGDERPALYTIKREGLVGWLDDGVGVRGEEIPRPLGHGRFVTPVYRTARTVTQEGLIFTSTYREQTKAMRRLTAMIAGGQIGRFRVQEDPADVTYGDVQIVKCSASRIAPGTVAKYRFELSMPIPMIYGEERSFGADEPAYHYGTFDAVPQIYVTGDRPAGYTVSVPGAQYIVTQALTVGVTHRIDMDTGWLYRNGQLQHGAVSRADTWVIPPGREVVHSIAGGTGTFRVDVRDTYM